MTGADTDTPQFNAPDAAGVIQLALAVADDAGAVATDTIVLGVFNQDPIAVISTGAGCANSGTTIALDGTASSDPNGYVASYAWTQIAGTAVALAGSDGPIATFTAPADAVTPGLCPYCHR